MIRKAIATLVLGVVCAISAKATLLTYTETGGNISGSLNGTLFSGATWTITATADASAAGHYAVGGNGDTIYAPVWYLFVTPTITINWGANTRSATLTGWDIESHDFSAFNPPETAAAILFSNANADGNTGVEQGNAAYLTGTSDLYNNLQSPGTFTAPSDFDTATYATSAGDLVVNTDSGATGTFIIAPAVVPEPASIALTTVGGLGVLLALRRAKKS